MALDSAFQPQAPSVLVSNTAIQVPALVNSLNMRVRNCSPTVQSFTWGLTGAVTAAGIPTAGVPSVNTVTMLGNSVESFTFPARSFFIADNATGFEFTPGEGI
jgi:hypothetical protein